MDTQVSGFKKCRTWKDLLTDPRIDKSDCIKNYDGPGTHHIGCIEGYRFNRFSTIEIGSVSDLCYAVNEYLEPWNPPN